MGNAYTKFGISKETVIKDITGINKITTNDLFIKRTQLSLEFSITEDNAMETVFKKKVINAKVYTINNSVKSYYKDTQLSLKKFYHFYTILMNSLPLFYQKGIQRKYIQSKSKEDDDICPICEERKVNLMLECYHFFCENCISTWLFEKKSSCPLCRYEVNLNKYSEGNLDRIHWNIVDLDNSAYENDTSQTFDSILNKLFQ